MFRWPEAGILLAGDVVAWRLFLIAPPTPQVLLGGGVLAYGLYNSMYNVEGGHRAIKFNRLVGIKEKIYPEVRGRGGPVGGCKTGVTLSQPLGGHQREKIYPEVRVSSPARRKGGGV